MALSSELHGQELVAVKEGKPAEALRHEAELLADLDHPGIIRFVALTGDDESLRLLTRYAGRETLATWQPQRLEELRRVAEELAEAIRYLHERKILHGDIRPAHVVIDGLRRPQLCGFSAARHYETEGVADQLADVTAIGETLLATLQRLEARQSRPGLRRHEQRACDRLRSVAQSAASGRIPSAKALASRLRDTASEPRTPDDTSERRRERVRPLATVRPQLFAPDWGRLARPAWMLRGRRQRRRWLTVATVGAGCAAGTLMVLQLGDENGSATPVATAVTVETPANGRGDNPGAPGSNGGETPPPEPTIADPAASAIASPAPPTAAPEEPEALDLVAGCEAPAVGARDVDGDGCAEQIEISEGFVSVDDVRYPVGAPGDQIAVGDWDCDGVATVALVQPGGQVYLFPSWPQHRPLVGTLVADLPPPTELNPVTRGTCHELRVTYPAGTWYLPLPSPTD